MVSRLRPMAGDVQAGSPVVAVLMGLLVTVALAGTAYVVIAGIGGEERFHAAAVRLDSSDGELRMDLLSGQVEMDSSYLMVSVDGAEPERVALNSLSDQTGDPLQWRAGNPLCIVGDDPGCLYDEGAEVDVQLITGESRIFDRTETVIGGAATTPSGAGSNGPYAYEDTDGDHVFTPGVDVLLDSGELDDGEHDSPSGLVLPEAMGDWSRAGKMELSADGDIVIDVALTSTGDKIEVTSRNGTVALTGDTVWASDKVEVTADQDVLVQADITSDAHMIEIKTEGALDAPSTVMVAQDKIEMEAGGVLSVEAADLTSHANKVELKAGGALTADHATISAASQVTLEGCPVSTQATSITSGETEIEDC